eukprot:scaffold422425_cov55-Attheya_sp.AAC.4
MICYVPAAYNCTNLPAASRRGLLIMGTSRCQQQLGCTIPVDTKIPEQNDVLNYLLGRLLLVQIVHASTRRYGTVALVSTRYLKYIIMCYWRRIGIQPRRQTEIFPVVLDARRNGHEAYEQPTARPLAYK